MPILQKPLAPYWQTTDKKLIRLYNGDILDVTPRLPAKSVHMVVTSPPYWALRDYGIAGQIGSEPTSEEFVETMVKVFREVHRVLRDDGTLWLNLGDNYLKGQLQGMPWRVALALQADGWILRQDIIWSKPSPMPESCKNRCTKSHEYMFLLTKRQDYFYDAEAIKENSSEASIKIMAAGYNKREKALNAPPQVNHLNQNQDITNRSVQGLVESGKCNKRSVWSISSQGYEGAHFATFPELLIEPCILAGTSEYGCCAKCGAPYKRITETEQLKRDRPNEFVKRVPPGLSGPKGEARINNGIHQGGVASSTLGMNTCANTVAGVRTKTIGWEATCDCKAAVVPCTVFEPFVGSGTTCCVSLAHGRRSIGVDLSKKYLDENCIPRIEGELWSRGMQHLFGRQSQPMAVGKSLTENRP